MLKKFLYTKVNNDFSGALIYLTPCLIIVSTLLYNNVDMLLSFAIGVISSIVIDPIILYYIADVDPGDYNG